MKDIKRVEFKLDLGLHSIFERAGMHHTYFGDETLTEWQHSKVKELVHEFRLGNIDTYYTMTHFISEFEKLYEIERQQEESKAEVFKDTLKLMDLINSLILPSGTSIRIETISKYESNRLKIEVGEGGAKILREALKNYFAKAKIDNHQSLIKKAQKESHYRRNSNKLRQLHAKIFFDYIKLENPGLSDRKAHIIIGKILHIGGLPFKNKYTGDPHDAFSKNPKVIERIRDSVKSLLDQKWD